MTHQDQIALYRLLARALAYPDKHFVGRLQDAVGQVRLDMWSDQRLPLGPLMQELGKLAHVPLDQVQGEYTRLFVNAYPHVPCPPYASAYVEGELLGQAAEEIDRLYRQWGLVVDGEAVGHAGSELEFMAYLLTLGTPESLAAAADFLSGHVLPWLPRFAADVERESRLGFYRAVGQLLAAVLHEPVTANHKEVMEST